MTTQDIITRIYADFGKTYKCAAQFVSSGPFWDFCVQTISDPVCMEKLVFANDLEVPPVKALLLLYERAAAPADDFTFTPQEGRCIGALMGFVFKFVLGYTEQKDRCVVGKYGIKTASRFLKGPVLSFTAE